MRRVRFDREFAGHAGLRARSAPAGAILVGPAIVAQLDTTVLIDPGARAEVDRLGNLVIDVQVTSNLAGDRWRLTPSHSPSSRTACKQICSEMDLVHEKTSFSPVISEAFDRSNGIYHRDTGRGDRAGRDGPADLRRRDAVHDPGGDRAQTRPRAGRRYNPVNDPYLGGTHLMDVKMVKPFYLSGTSSGVTCPTPATGRTPAAWCRAASPPRRPRSSRRACASRR